MNKELTANDTVEGLLEKIQLLEGKVNELEKAKKDAKEKLDLFQKQEETLTSIFNAAPAGIGMVRDRVFVEVNPAVIELTGYSREELLGKKSRILYSNDWDYEFVGEEKYKQIKDLGAGTVETVWKRKDGVLVDILLSSKPIDESDLSKGVIFTAKDISGSKKIQNALESSEERLKIIYQHAPDAIFLCDKDGNYFDGNLALESILGYSRSELKGKSFLSMGVFEKHEIVEAQKILTCSTMGQKTGPDELIIRQKDGGSIHIEVITYPVRIEGRMLTLGIARDLTERLKQEKFKRDSEQRISMHVNQTTLAVIEWDLDLKITNWNPAAEKIFGFSRKEAIGQLPAFFIPETDLALVENVWERLFKSKESVWGTNWNLNKNGDKVLCEWHNTPLKNENGEIVAIASLGLDVTNRNRSEKIQRVIYEISNATNTADNLKHLIENIRTELSNIIDTRNFFVALYNKENETFSLPFFADEKDNFKTFPIGKTLAGYVLRNQETLFANKSELKTLIEEGKVELVGAEPEVWLGVPLIVKGEATGVLAVQSYLDEDAYSVEDRKVLEFVSSQISLSVHRKNAEIEMAKALEKAKESDRLKSAFLANMSHEIRTPMNGILGFTNLLNSDDLSREDQRKYTSIIETSGKRMLGIINDLIDISKIESGMINVSLSEFNLNDSMDYVYSFFNPEARQKELILTYSTDLKYEDALICSDLEKLSAVLINLVKNALKYTDSGEINFGYTVVENRIRFHVKDTGIGIKEEKLEVIFNRFVQADRQLSSNYEGVGLGLAITKAYIDLLEGKIWVESEYQVGSTFYFEIPFMKGKEDKNTEFMENPIKEKSNKGLKILLAEDDKINQRLFSYMLKDASEELIIVDNGEEALETYKNTPNIDLVLMDIKMPGMDGYEATRRIKAYDKEARIIALSAFALEHEKQKAIEGGFCDYVSKPVSKQALLGTIDKYLK